MFTFFFPSSLGRCFIYFLRPSGPPLLCAFFPAFVCPFHPASLCISVCIVLNLDSNQKIEQISVRSVMCISASNQWKLVMSLRMRWWCLLIQTIAIVVLALSPDWGKSVGIVFLLAAVIPGICYFAVTCSFGCCGPNSGGNDQYRVECPTDSQGVAQASDQLLPDGSTKTIHVSNYGLFGPMWISVLGIIGGILLWSRNNC